jgi:hypothetical protein
MVTISTTVAVIATGRTDEAPAPHTQYTIDAIEARDLAGGIVFCGVRCSGWRS